MCSIRRVSALVRASPAERMAVVGKALRFCAVDTCAARRLAPYLLLAVFLHGVVVLGLRLPDAAGKREPPPLRLSWREPASLASAPLPVQPAVESSRPLPEPARIPDFRGQRAAPRVEAVRVPRVPVPAVSAPTVLPSLPPPAPAVESSRLPVSADLLDSARRMARDIGREGVRDGAAGGMIAAAGRGVPSVVDRAALPELDRALRKRSAGEERLGGGILRITTESGRVYCLKPPSDLVRDGPVEPLAVPTNCP